MRAFISAGCVYNHFNSNIWSILYWSSHFLSSPRHFVPFNFLINLLLVLHALSIPLSWGIQQVNSLGVMSSQGFYRLYHQSYIIYASAMQREYFHTGNDFKLRPILRLFISTCPCHIFLIKSIYILISFFSYRCIVYLQYNCTWSWVCNLAIICWATACGGSGKRLELHCKFRRKTKMKREKNKKETTGYIIQIKQNFSVKTVIS